MKLVSDLLKTRLFEGGGVVFSVPTTHDIFVAHDVSEAFEFDLRMANKKK